MRFIIGVVVGVTLARVNDRGISPAIDAKIIKLVSSGVERGTKYLLDKATEESKGEKK